MKSMCRRSAQSNDLTLLKARVDRWTKRLRDESAPSSSNTEQPSQEVVSFITKLTADVSGEALSDIEGGAQREIALWSFYHQIAGGFRQLLKQARYSKSTDEIAVQAEAKVATGLKTMAMGLREYMRRFVEIYGAPSAVTRQLEQRVDLKVEPLNLMWVDQQRVVETVAFFTCKLGDLWRYRHELLVDSTVEWSKKARRYYNCAMAIDPDNGMPCNQMAQVALEETLYFDAVYWGLKSQLVTAPFLSDNVPKVCAKFCRLKIETLVEQQPNMPKPEVETIVLKTVYALSRCLLSEINLSKPDSRVEIEMTHIGSLIRQGLVPSKVLCQLVLITIMMIEYRMKCKVVKNGETIYRIAVALLVAVVDAAHWLLRHKKIVYFGGVFPALETVFEWSKSFTEKYGAGTEGLDLTPLLTTYTEYGTFFCRNLSMQPSPNPNTKDADEMVKGLQCFPRGLGCNGSTRSSEDHMQRLMSVITYLSSVGLDCKTDDGGEQVVLRPRNANNRGRQQQMLPIDTEY